MMPLPTALEPLSELLPLGLLGAYLAGGILNVNPCYFFVGHFVFWMLCDFVLMRTLEVRKGEGEEERERERESESKREREERERARASGR